MWNLSLLSGRGYSRLGRTASASFFPCLFWIWCPPEAVSKQCQEHLAQTDQIANADSLSSKNPTIDYSTVVQYVLGSLRPIFHVTVIGYYKANSFLWKIGETRNKYTKKCRLPKQLQLKVFWKRQNWSLSQLQHQSLIPFLSRSVEVFLSVISLCKCGNRSGKVVSTNRLF